MQKTTRHLSLAISNDAPTPSGVTALPELKLVWQRAAAEEAKKPEKRDIMSPQRHDYYPH